MATDPARPCRQPEYSLDAAARRARHDPFFASLASHLARVMLDNGISELEMIGAVQLAEERRRRQDLERKWRDVAAGRTIRKMTSGYNITREDIVDDSPVGVALENSRPAGDQHLVDVQLAVPYNPPEESSGDFSRRHREEIAANQRLIKSIDRMTAAPADEPQETSGDFFRRVMGH